MDNFCLDKDIQDGNMMSHQFCKMFNQNKGLQGLSTGLPQSTLDLTFILLFTVQKQSQLARSENKVNVQILARG